MSIPDALSVRSLEWLKFEDRKRSDQFMLDLSVLMSLLRDTDLLFILSNSDLGTVWCFELMHMNSSLQPKNGRTSLSRVWAPLTKICLAFP